MPKPTEMEIRIGESYDPDVNQRIRVIKSKDNPGRFILVQAKPEALMDARSAGKDFEWIEVTEEGGVSADQIGDFIAAKLKQTS